jgi:hypothetical protein
VGSNKCGSQIVQKPGFSGAWMPDNHQRAALGRGSECRCGRTLDLDCALADPDLGELCESVCDRHGELSETGDVGFEFRAWANMDSAFLETNLQPGSITA